MEKGLTGAGLISKLREALMNVPRVEIANYACEFEKLTGKTPFSENVEEQ